MSNILSRTPINPAPILPPPDIELIDIAGEGANPDEPVHIKIPEYLEDPVFYHNWLYSVVPVGERTEEWVALPEGGTRTQVDYPLAAYLTGYCRNCTRVFSEKIPTGWGYIETQMNISKEGCVAPR